MAAVTPTDRPKSVRNRCLIELFVAMFVLSLCPFDISVGVGAFVIRLSQISFFFFSMFETRLSWFLYDLSRCGAPGSALISRIVVIWMLNYKTLEPFSAAFIIIKSLRAERVIDCHEHGHTDLRRGQSKRHVLCQNDHHYVVYIVLLANCWISKQNQQTYIVLCISSNIC